MTPKRQIIFNAEARGRKERREFSDACGRNQPLQSLIVEEARS